MRLVIADTSPVILIGCIEILPRLFMRLVLPSAVEAELTSADAPEEVRSWMTRPPAWLEIINAPAVATLPAFIVEKRPRSRWRAL